MPAPPAIRRISSNPPTPSTMPTRPKKHAFPLSKTEPLKPRPPLQELSPAIPAWRTPAASTNKASPSYIGPQTTHEVRRQWILPATAHNQSALRRKAATKDEGPTAPTRTTKTTPLNNKCATTVDRHIPLHTTARPPTDNAPVTTRNLQPLPRQTATQRRKAAQSLKQSNRVHNTTAPATPQPTASIETRICLRLSLHQPKRSQTLSKNINSANTNNQRSAAI